MKKPKYPCGATHDPNELDIEVEHIFKMPPVKYYSCRCVLIRKEAE
jgi:hypothetical protein